LFTPVMFMIIGCATCILLVVILIAASNGKGSAVRSHHNHHTEGARRPASKSNLAEKLRPTVRQGLDTKAVPQAASTCAHSEAAPPAISKSLAYRTVEPVAFLPTLLSSKAPAGPVAGAVETLDPVASAELGAAPAPEAAEVKEAAHSLVQEPSFSDASVLPNAARSKVEEFTSFPLPIESTEVADPNFTPCTGQETAECEVSQGLLVAEPVEELGAPNLLAFYGLTQQPFDLTPDPAYLYRSRVHREALTALSQGIENLRGFAALVAEPGMGKTTLLNKLMEELRDSARIVFLFQTQCNSSELLRYLLTELGIEHGGMDIVTMHKALSQFLNEEMLQGRRVVLIVDEAQNLQDSVLETIRLLSNYETTHSKLIQIVLAGQLQLIETLMRPGLVQLRQRIAVVANLEPLDAVETAEYIEHRLRAAGAGDLRIFTPDAMELIAERSEGIPRSINNICFNAMLAGYLHRQLIIDSGMVNRVASKLDLERIVRRPQQEPVSSSLDESTEPSELSQLAQLLCAALTGKTLPEAAAASDSKGETKASVLLTGKLIEKLTSQNWRNKTEFRIQVSLERDCFPGLPVAEHYYCRSFYVSEAQAKSLDSGKAVRVRFEQD
jgi:general secretion pathway protein A